MTQTTSQPQISDFLRQTAPFDRLKPETVRQLAAKAQLLRYRVGQPILVRDKMPAQISIIYQGQVRVLGYDRRIERTTSLRVVGEGEVLGWIGVVRGIPCETVIASTETVCISIPVQDFRAGLSAEPSFDRAVREHPSLSEVFELTSAELQRRADTSSNAKDLCYEIWPQATVLDFPAGTQLDPNRLDRNRVWLISSGKFGDADIGSRLDLDRLSAITLPSPLRLVGLPWPQNVARSLPSVTPETDGQIVPISEESSALSGVTEAPPRPQEPPRDPLAPPPKYPYVRGSGPIGSPLACFHMLCKHMRINFRKDAIRKLLEQQLKSKGAVSLYGCGTIMPTLGVSAQLARVPTNAIGRLKAPGMMQWQDSYAVIYSISEKEVVLAVPEVGILHRTPDRR